SASWSKAGTEPFRILQSDDPHVQPMAWLLGETPLSSKQSLKPLPDSDWQRLCAVVPDDRETLWWVFGLGENVKVLEPKNWVQVIREKAAALEALYTEIELP
ncbi:WYL domain-containing protein, partial [Pseudomonas aeruginosa]|uniref:WYL domain-containing protein n=1 Tax=Pseudomonas aeruginosa TaxID=287 RepID=UPI0031B736F2